MLYWIHRAAHKIPLMNKYHSDHHAAINRMGTKSQWEWNNLVLFNDTWRSSIDLWITEVIPTLIFSFVINSYWPIIVYYFWAALLQEKLEHNKDLNLYPFTSGRWHLQHHACADKNYGLFVPIWDIVFKTEYDRA